MADFTGWVSDVLGLLLAHIGAPDPLGVDVTLGLVLAASLIFGLAIFVFRMIRGR